MKKFLCVLIAVVIALTSITIFASADTPNITMTADKTNVNAGDIITVTVKAGNKSNLASATFDVVYDKAFFELVPGSLKGTDAMGATINEKYAENKARYIGTLERFLKTEAVLFTVQFKVLKRGGSISLDAVEVYYVDAEILGERKNVTAEIKESLKDDVIKVNCPHADCSVSENAPTCTADGRKVETCKECGYVKDTVIPKLGHKGEEYTVKAATCSEKGKVAKKCTVCNAVYDEKDVEKLAHTGEEYTVKEATCTEKGKVAKKCTVCNAIYDEKETATITHDMRDFTVKEATCQEKGVEGKKCTMCGKVTDEKETATIDHKMEWTVTKPATCTEKGEETYKCTMCDYSTEKREITTKGAHDLKDKVSKEATCEEDGLKTQYCTKCEYISEPITITKTGHTPGEWVVSKKPTTKEEGLEEKKCTTCKKVLESRKLGKLDEYVLGDVNRDNYVTAVDARFILQNVAGLKDFTPTQKAAADVNGDGKITAVDSRIILRVVAGLQTL